MTLRVSEGVAGRQRRQQDVGVARVRRLDAVLKVELEVMICVGCRVRVARPEVCPSAGGSDYGRM